MVVTSELTDKPWLGYIYDFKVYDNNKPLRELQRFIDLKKGNDYKIKINTNVKKC